MARDSARAGDRPNANQRRPEYTRDDEWIRAFLRRGQVAHFASLRDDQPFITPSTYYFDEARQRLIFHSNIAGRLRANVDRDARLCADVFELGRLLPSNVALEFSLQYRSVVVFGTAEIIADPVQQRDLMQRLIGKYFTDLEPGKDYRPVTDKELKRTSVYAMKIESWSGKENWKDQADQSSDWPALDKKWTA